MNIRVVLFVLVLFAVAMRWVFPEADPPVYIQTGAAYWDESIASEARSEALFGQWTHDGYRSYLMAPFYSAVTSASLRWWGGGYLGLRFPSIVSGTLLILLAYLGSRWLGFSVAAGLAAASFLAFSWSMTGFGRVAIMEPVLLLNMSAAIFFLIGGEMRRSVVLVAAAGIAAGLALLTKVTAIWILLPMGIFVSLGKCIPAQNNLRWRVIRVSAFGISAALAAVIGFWIWIRPDLSRWIVIHQFYAGTRMQSGIAGYMMNLYHLFDNPVFLTSAPAYLAIFLFLPELLTYMQVAPAGKSFGLHLTFSVLAVGLLLVSCFDIPARRLAWVDLLAPFCIAGLWDLGTILIGQSAVPWGGRWLQTAFAVGGALLGGLLIVKWFVTPEGGYFSLVDPQKAMAVLFSTGGYIAGSFLKPRRLQLGLALVIGCLLFLLHPLLRSKIRSVLLSMLVLQILLYVAFSVAWLNKLSFSLREASLGIGNVAGESYVLGNRAVSLSFQNRTRPLFWYSGIQYANKDERVLDEVFSPQYWVAMDTAETLESIREFGSSFHALGSSWSLVSAFPVSEMEFSGRLTGYALLLKRNRPESRNSVLGE